MIPLNQGSMTRSNSRHWVTHYLREADDDLHDWVDFRYKRDKQRYILRMKSMKASVMGNLNAQSWCAVCSNSCNGKQLSPKVQINYRLWYVHKRTGAACSKRPVDPLTTHSLQLSIVDSER